MKKHKKIENKQVKKIKEPKKVKEIGGQKGPEPTRYGDWEKNGRVSDIFNYLFILLLTSSFTTLGSARVDMSPS